MKNLLIDKAAVFVTDLFEKNNTDNLIYHNLKHTQKVVAHCNEISEHYVLDDEEHENLIVAAWLHDTGHLFTEPEVHEEKGTEVADQFAKENFLSDEKLQKIKDYIMVTKMPRKPQNIVEQIICDADTYNLGTKEFKETNKKVKREMQMRGMDFNKEEWRKMTLALLEKHEFYTPYAQQKLNAGKQANIQKLREKLKEVAPEEPEKFHETLMKKQNSFMTKGIQTMLRLTSDNHLELSGMADGKANILISVNAIIISVILSVLLRRLEVDTYLTIPTILFLCSSMATIVLAILATRPKITEGRFSQQDITDKKTNLLFFGNFYKASYDEYNNAMRQLMQDSDYLYGSLIKDIYMLGVVLGRKYKLIRLAYTIFMIGIIVSVIAFTIAVILNSMSQGGPVSNSSAMPL